MAYLNARLFFKAVFAYVSGKAGPRPADNALCSDKTFQRAKDKTRGKNDARWIVHAATLALNKIYSLFFREVHTSSRQFTRWPLYLAILCAVTTKHSSVADGDINRVHS